MFSLIAAIIYFFLVLVTSVLALCNENHRPKKNELGSKLTLEIKINISSGDCSLLLANINLASRPRLGFSMPP